MRFALSLPSARKVASVLALCTGLTVAFVSSAAAAGGPNLSGWGVRDTGSFMGSITQQPDGSLSGHFTVIINEPGEDPIYCRYLRFTPNRMHGASWNFDGYGVCYGSAGSFPAANRFVLIDRGTPGAGLDYMDLNYYGAVGISIPGGLFDEGEITYTP